MRRGNGDGLLSQWCERAAREALITADGLLRGTSELLWQTGDAQTPREVVADLWEWEQREGFTSEWLCEDILDRRHSARRVTRLLSTVYFATLRNAVDAGTFPPPDPATRLTFDECEAAGVDGTLRTIGGES